MTSICFDAPVVVIGDRRIVRLPAEASARLPSRGQVAATGTIGERPVELVIEPDGMRGHWVNVDPGLEGAVRVELVPTKAWPEPQLPEDFGVALGGVERAAETWTDITPMARWEWVRWIDSTRNEQTRSRRLEVGVDKLRKGMRRPCCSDLASCTDPELSRGGKLVE